MDFIRKMKVQRSMCKNMENKNYKIPLVLGITGHRDINECNIESLKQKVFELFDYLIDKYPNTPIVFLSPLADGADRIAAQVALENKYQNHITISVPLPMDIKNYKDTFAKGITKYKNSNEHEKIDLKNKSKEDFDNLLEQISQQANGFVPKTIPMLFDLDIYEKLDQMDEKDIDECLYKKYFSKYVQLPKNFQDFEKKLKEENEEKNKNYTKNSYLKQQIRREQYSIVGEYIAIHSNILIAMYDEKEKEKAGGTKEIVRKKLTGDYEHFNILDEDVTYPENGIVYSIDTPKGDKTSETNYQIKKLFPITDQECRDCFKSKGKEKVCEHIGLEQNNKKNNDIFIRLYDKIKDKFFQPCICSNEKESLNLYTQYHKHIECFNKEVDAYGDTIMSKADNDIKELTDCNDKLIHKNIMIRRSAAYLSGFYQDKMKHFEKYILVLICMTVFTILMKSDYRGFEYIAFIDILYIFVLLLFFPFYQQFKGYKEKTEDYRAISEALRIQTAWNMANINQATALYYLSHQQDEIGWIRAAVRGMNIFFIPKSKNESFNEDQIYKYWVKEQIDYFNNNLNKHQETEDTMDFKARISFGAFFSFTLLFTALSYVIDNNPILFLGLTVVDALKITLIGISLTYFSYISSKKIFDGNNDIVREYKLSLDIFSKAKKLLDDPKKDKQQVYKNLGIEALRENSSWLITRRTKEYNTPS